MYCEKNQCGGEMKRIFFCMVLYIYMCAATDTPHHMFIILEHDVLLPLECSSCVFYFISGPVSLLRTITMQTS